MHHLKGAISLLCL